MPVACALLALGLSTSVASANELYVTDSNALGGPGAVLGIDSSTGAQTPVSSGDMFSAPPGIARQPDGNLIVSDVSNGTLLRVDPATGAQTVVSSGGNFVSREGWSGSSAAASSSPTRTPARRARAR